MILIFLVAGFFSCLIVVACFLSQTDARILTLSRRHTVFLYSLIIAILGIPEALLLLGTWLIGPHPRIALGIAFFQFVLLAVVYARYRLTGVLALHCAGILIYFTYAVMVTILSLVICGEVPVLVDSDTGLFLGLAAVSGSLASALYAIVHIAIRRRKVKQAGS